MPLSSDYAPLADEVNPPFSHSTPAARVTRSGTITYSQNVNLLDDDGGGDLGQVPRYTTQQKGKGRASTWDVEQGYPIDDNRQGNASGSYPPTSNEEEEERRIQAASSRNLARLNARDRAEKRARQSRLFRPLSIKSESTLTQHNSRLAATGPTSRSSESLPTPSSPSNLLPDIPETIQTAPKTPTTPSRPINPFDTPNERLHPDPNSPQPAAFYVGPEWRGGGGRGARGSSPSMTEPPDETRPPHDPSRLRRILPDKWYKAIFAWGDDLDGGHEDQEDGGQAGRTNPFE